MITAHSLTKRYGAATAVDHLTFEVTPGVVTGFLGPNGSGKSTALRLLLGFLRPSAGEAAIGGFNCWAESVEVRKRVAYLPGELRLYETMTGRQLITFLGKLRGDPPGAEVEAFARKLDVDIDKPLMTMSSGMKRKVALITVLVPRVPLIILDEPTNTLDPTMRDELLEQLREARARGQAVLFSSHVLQEVEAICDRVAILRRGELAHCQSMADLRGARSVSAQLSGPVPGTGPLGEPLNADAVRGGRLTLIYQGPLPRLLSWLAEQELADLKIEPLGLGPIYRKIHG